MGEKKEISELINRISKQTQIDAEIVRRFVTSFFRSIEKGLLTTSFVKIEGLGIFRILKSGNSFKIIFLGDSKKSTTSLSKKTNLERVAVSVKKTERVLPAIKQTEDKTKSLLNIAEKKVVVENFVTPKEKVVLKSTFLPPISTAEFSAPLPLPIAKPSIDSEAKIDVIEEIYSEKNKVEPTVAPVIEPIVEVNNNLVVDTGSKVNENKGTGVKVIEIRDLNKTYYSGAPLHVLKGINIDVEKGEFLSIMGASGSGKSTLLNILGILDTYDTGEYYLDNLLVKDLSETKSAEIRNQKIGFIFQSFNLISFKNALENVALPLYYQGVSRKQRNALALEYLDKMGLKSHAHHMPNELSGGQKQRVAIARALIARPQIILADEPTGALDSNTSKEVMQLLRTVNQQDKITMLIVTHEKAVAEATDRIIHIKDGLIGSIEVRNNKISNNV